MAQDVTREARARLRGLLAKTTPGPWCPNNAADPEYIVTEAPGVEAWDDEVTGILRRAEDVALIAAAVNALPALLDALDAAEAERDDARAQSQYDASCYAEFRLADRQILRALEAERDAAQARAERAEDALATAEVDRDRYAREANAVEAHVARLVGALRGLMAQAPSAETLRALHADDATFARPTTLSTTDNALLDAHAALTTPDLAALAARCPGCSDGDPLVHTCPLYAPNTRERAREAVVEAARSVAARGHSDTCDFDMLGECGCGLVTLRAALDALATAPASTPASRG